MYRYVTVYFTIRVSDHYFVSAFIVQFLHCRATHPYNAIMYTLIVYKLIHIDRQKLFTSTIKTPARWNKMHMSNTTIYPLHSINVDNMPRLLERREKTAHTHKRYIYGHVGWHLSSTRITIQKSALPLYTLCTCKQQHHSSSTTAYSHNH